MNPKSMFAACGIGLSLAGAATHNAEARSTTGFSAFRVEIGGVGQYPQDPYTCLVENYGAVVNKCANDPNGVSLVFDLPNDTVGTKTAIVQDYWLPWGPTSASPPPFTCTLFSYFGNAPTAQAFQSATFTYQRQSLIATAPVGNNGSLQLICWNVPYGAGIANINWNP
jgi:hypothetical protein